MISRASLGHLITSVIPLVTDFLEKTCVQVTPYSCSSPETRSHIAAIVLALGVCLAVGAPAKMLGGMEDSHRKTLVKHRLFLLNEMLPDEVLEHLRSENILTQLMYDKIKAKRVTFDQNSTLLDLLPKRGPKAFSLFCRALRATEQEHLAERLEDELQDRMCITPEHNNCKTSVEETRARRSLWTESSEWSIDGGDGPVAFHCCSVDFYLAHHQEAYKLSSCPRGLAIIISNVAFTTPDLDYRHGGNVDFVAMKQLYSRLGYSVISYNDLTAQDILSALSNFSRRSEHAQLDSCIVALLSHGVDGAVYGVDGKLVQLQEVFAMLDNAHCPHLQNKPKMFFIQACRGEETDRGVDQQDGREQSASPGCEEMDAGKEMVKMKLPKQSDMICAYACLKGTVSLRNTKRGSWFVEALISVFSQHAKDTHVADMLVQVNALIKEREGHAPGTEFHRCKEMSEYCSTLCRKLYLFPGIAQASSP
uniref:Caspase-2 n=1 Tax=Leptobrachium leishanense TaxID=445787 RepID=A0A8C5R7U2_9ANUR